MSALPRRRWRRRLAIAASLLLICGAVFLGRGLWNAMRDPVVRTGTIVVDAWPVATPPLRVLLISDVHVAGPDMHPARLEHIVTRLNALHPDMILIAGDLVSEKRFATRHYAPTDVVTPLGALHARLGVIAALGNHDHWADAPAYAAALRRVGITVLQNQAVRRGPLIIGGVDDDFSEHADIPATFAAMDAIGAGPRIIVTHSPDIVPALPHRVAAVFAGHTHCGQIILPIIGQTANVSRYGQRFNCGLINDAGQMVVVGAGLGTSVLPLRYGAMPDVWLITLMARS